MERLTHQIIPPISGTDVLSHRLDDDNDDDDDDLYTVHVKRRFNLIDSVRCCHGDTHSCASRLLPEYPETHF